MQISSHERSKRCRKDKVLCTTKSVHSPAESKVFCTALYKTSNQLVDLSQLVKGLNCQKQRKK